MLWRLFRFLGGALVFGEGNLSLGISALPKIEPRRGAAVLSAARRFHKGLRGPCQSRGRRKRLHHRLARRRSHAILPFKYCKHYHPNKAWETPVFKKLYTHFPLKYSKPFPRFFHFQAQVKIAPAAPPSPARSPPCRLRRLARRAGPHLRALCRPWGTALYCKTVLPVR